jgi:phosphotransferase system HPr (HPr) family protein
MQTQTLRIQNAVGLHARPAALFVQTTHRFEADVRVRNKTTNSDWVEARSILRVMALGVSKGHEIELKATGADEAEALRAIEDLVAGNFGESGP